MMLYLATAGVLAHAVVLFLVGAWLADITRHWRAWWTYKVDMNVTRRHFVAELADWRKRGAKALLIKWPGFKRGRVFRYERRQTAQQREDVRVPTAEELEAIERTKLPDDWVTSLIHTRQDNTGSPVSKGCQ